MALDELTIASVQDGVYRFLQTTSHDDTETVNMKECHRLSQGVHHAVYLVGADHVLHALPYSLKNAKSLERDRGTTSLLKRYISSPETISVPSTPFRIEGWICTLQKRLLGISLEEVPSARSWDKTIDGFVHLLVTLRNVPHDEAMKVLYYEHERPNLQKRVAKARRKWEDLVGGGHVEDADGCKNEALSATRLQTLPEAPYKQVLLHGDLSMQHIFIDQAGGGVITGVIDWSDAMLGDPCEDIAGVVLCLGVCNARKVASAARYDEHTVERGVLFAKCLAVEDLWDLKFGSEKMPPEALMRSQFEMAFEESSQRETFSSSS